MPADAERISPTPDADLLAEVAWQSSRSTPAVLGALVRRLHERFGEGLDAVLLYGSCLHSGDPADGIVDLYALVRDYRAAYSSRFHRWFNEVLPPNVFYVEVAEGGAMLRAKYAVLSLEDFAEGATSWFHSYVWARFAQPCRILWTRDAATAASVHRTLAGAARTFLANVLPTLAGEEVGAEAIWARGLALTYASELRPEREERVRWLVERNLSDYARLTSAAAPTLPRAVEVLEGGRYRARATDAERSVCLRRWRRRRWQGKALSVLRLGKSVFTFAGAADYVAWKVRRHTGVAIEVTPFMRRHPLLVAPWMLLRLLRRGVVR